MTDDDFDLDLGAMQKQGLVTEIVGELKSGKEATVYLARSAAGLIVVKRFRAMAGRRFHTDAKYRQGRQMRDRDARAFDRRTRYGRQYAQNTWIAAEHGMLRRLGRAGAIPVPRVIARVGACILMEFIADTAGSERPAVRLVDAEVLAHEAARLHSRIMLAIIGMFERHVVHADLSPFNILMPHGSESAAGDSGADAAPMRFRPVIIDFPQAVDPRKNPNARELLAHDVGQVTRFFQRFDPKVADNDLAARLWATFERGSL